jgi:hypothetical protein
MQIHFKIMQTHFKTNAQCTMSSGKLAKCTIFSEKWVKMGGWKWKFEFKYGDS